ncbi:TadE/TadG family type IV pilus assembly protein [Vibrio paucivorans]
MRMKLESGYAAVEMTLVVPVLLLLFVATVDAGRVMYASITNSNAARVAAGYGAQSASHATDFTGMNTIALNDAGDLVIDGNNETSVGVSSRRFCRCPGSTTEVNCTSNSCSSSTQIFVEVTTTRDFRTTISYPGVPEQIQLSDTAEIRVQ